MMFLRAVALAALLSACAAAPDRPVIAPGDPTGTPTWDRPGLGGAVRPEMGSPQPGESAPDFSLPNLEGREVSLSSMRGSWVFLHFTATWCPFCDSEVSHIGALSDEFQSRGVRTVIVDVEENAATWHSYAAKHVAASMIALHDASGAGAARFAPPHAQPSFDDRAQAALDGTLIDPQGKIRLFLLPDSAHLRWTFRAVRGELERLIPQPVLAVDAPAASVSAAVGTAEFLVTLRVAPGYHVMSDRPSEPNYIPTRVALDRGERYRDSSGRCATLRRLPSRWAIARSPPSLASSPCTFRPLSRRTLRPGCAVSMGRCAIRRARSRVACFQLRVTSTSTSPCCPEAFATWEAAEESCGSSAPAPNR